MIPITREDMVGGWEGGMCVWIETVCGVVDGGWDQYAAKRWW